MDIQLREPAVTFGLQVAQPFRAVDRCQHLLSHLPSASNPLGVVPERVGNSSFCLYVPPVRSIGEVRDLALRESNALAFFGEVEGADPRLGSCPFGAQRVAVSVVELGADVVPVVELSHEPPICCVRAHKASRSPHDIIWPPLWHINNFVLQY
ncbi:hypothetical protein GCM10009827_019070 [Dactylosporangium maewongense]|uniref:Uncharacterized protein n=1 Tax=Dactylosporangium maewongense TaxID=634393 RepID=A0ABN1ZVN5_9ACTN